MYLQDDQLETYVAQGAEFEKMLHALVRAEAWTCGIAPHEIDWDFRVAVGDGGRDILIRCGSTNTVRKFIPAIPSVWSAKSGKNGLSVATFRNEIEGHPKLREHLQKRGAYVWCAVAAADNDGTRDNLRAEVARISNELGLNPKQFVFFFRDALTSWLNLHIGVASLYFHLPRGWKTLEEWQQRDKNFDMSWVDFGSRPELLKTLQQHLLGNSRPNVLHLAGWSGIGKTRTVLESCLQEKGLEGVLYFPNLDDFTTQAEDYLVRNNGLRVAVVVDEVEFGRVNELRPRLAKYHDRIRVVTIGPISVQSVEAQANVVYFPNPDTEGGVSAVIRAADPSLDSEQIFHLAGLCDHDLRLALILVEANQQNPWLTDLQAASIEHVWGIVLKRFKSDIGDVNKFRELYDILCSCLDVGNKGEARSELEYLAQHFGKPITDFDHVIAQAVACGLARQQGRFVELQRALALHRFGVAKLARSTKARAIIQLCFYSDLLSQIQGPVPEFMHVVLGGGAAPEKFLVHHYLAYFRKIRRDFEAGYAANAATYPEPVEHCGICDWFTVCDKRWHDDDHLSLVASITRDQREALIAREIDSMATLAALQLPITPKLDRIAPAPLLRIREQARVQVEGREKGEPVFEFIAPDERDQAKRERRSGRGGETEKKAEALRGFAALPSPSTGDLFLDFEGDPFAFDQGLEYLIGTVTISEDGKPIYESIWSFDPKSEKRAFIEFIEKVKRAREVHPDMHIYHYAPYEPTAIKHLAGRHGVCADDVDELLRAGVFVDLFRVVRQGLRASVESYSIKKMEAFYGFRRTVALREATSSLQAFESVLALRDNPEEAKEILNTIADYNRDDCLSTWYLREWLEKLRGELETKLGQAITRPELKAGAASEGLEAELTEIGILKDRLIAGLPDEEDEWTNEQRACWLLAQLLDWHRREDKSMWWEYYRLCSLSDDELIEDKNALGGLVYLGVVDETKRSLIHRYSFPPQDHTIDRALEVHDPDTEQSTCSEFTVDEINLTIDLKRGKNSDKPHPTALIPHNYINSKKQVASLMRIAKWVADNGIDNRSNSQFQAARDALLRRRPRIAGGTVETAVKGSSPLEAAKKLALSLDRSILPIQGPPGSGKTYTGAHMVIALVNAGKRVGITANSHKVISNLLTALCEAAEETHTKLSIVQKPNEGDGCEHKFVTQTDDNGQVLAKLQNGEAQVAAGTTWLWSREEFAGSVDVLLVDEAGQMSLANVLAISPAAESVVLLGDPQQLDQPQKGVHPPGAEISALAHLLDGRATIEPEQGLFLGESWRLHPDICSFTSELFYEGRLNPRPENAQQRLNVTGPLDGTGLRFVPVEHSGNKSDAPEEVEAIARLIEGLLSSGATWTNKKGVTIPLERKHILIVAPYNAQVALLSHRLLKARVGTVDKFQGQQAPIVFYSMTTSNPEDAPRGMEFLYSANRLNVATSRAQCITVLVANPALFDAMQDATTDRVGQRVLPVSGDGGDDMNAASCVLKNAVLLKVADHQFKSYVKPPS